MTRSLSAATAAALVTVVASTAFGDGAGAQFKRGLRCFGTQDYACAIADFKASYQAEPNRDTLYALAQAYRLSGNCKDAEQAYLAFLRETPPEKERSLAEANLEKCRTILAAETKQPPKPIEPPQPAKPIATSPAREPFYTDVLGGVLSGLGLAGIGIGIGTWVASANNASAANDDRRYADFSAHVEATNSFGIAAIVSGSAGLALIVAGVVRYATLPGAASDGAPTLEADGETLSLHWRF